MSSIELEPRGRQGRNQWCGTPDERLQAHANAIRQRRQRMGEDAIAISRHLIAVRAQLPAGEFAGWVDRELGWGIRTALNFTRIAECFSGLDCPKFFVAEALRVLSNGHTPMTAVGDALAIARSGQVVTTKVARALIAERRPGPRTSREEATTRRIVGQIRYAMRRAPTHHRQRLAAAIREALEEHRSGTP